MEMIRVPLRDRCRGRWHGILPSIGIDRGYLTGKNGPCPLCPGGRDRWRFLDSEGVGTWICTRCGSGNGIDLVMQFTGLAFREAAARIESVLGDVVPRRPRPERSDQQIRASLNSMWKTAAPVRRFDVVDTWLRSRGLVLEQHPPCLRTAPKLRYYDAGGGSYHPAMLAMVAGPDGKPGTIHRTYLAHAGGKAAVDKPRKIFSPMPIGGAVRLAAPASTLGLAEGIETALAAAILFKVPTWAAICAHGIATFEPPADMRRLLVFADNDQHQVGQQAANSLASRMRVAGIATEIMVPEKPDQDWNDVLLDGGR